MQWSKYNYTFYSKEFGYLLYNALSNVFIQIIDEDVPHIEDLKKNPENILNFKEKQFFFDSKIIVENDLDEIAKIKVENTLNRYNKEHLTITIAPTLDCNFHCTYCYEESNKNTYMTSETEEQIVDFIKSFKNLKHIHICWYGGEPLLAIDIIERLTKNITTLEIPFSASMVTNGFLLNEENINKIKELNIKSIQVTLDGLEETHNKRRKHKNGQNSFKQIVDNLVLLFSINSDISVSVRVNIDEHNKNEFYPLLSYIRSMFSNVPSNRIVVYPAFVENIGVACNKEDCMVSAKAKATYLIDMFKKDKVYCMRFFPLLTINNCMARSINSYVISYDGKLYKCWNDIGIEEKSVGSVFTKGINTNLLARYLKGADNLEDEKCNTCFMFPTCNGGCPYLRIANLYDNTDHDYCHIAKENLEQFLEIHYVMRKEFPNNKNI